MDSLPNPKDFGGVECFVASFEAPPPPHPHFTLVVFGTRKNLGSFGVIDSRTSLLYTTAHCWREPSLYVYRRLNNGSNRHFEAVYNRKQLGPGEDVVISKVEEMVPNQIPILDGLGFDKIESQPCSTNVPRDYYFTCLLNGNRYRLIGIRTVNGHKFGLIKLTTFEGNSGTGFVDDSGRLFLLTGAFVPTGSGKQYALLTPVTRK